MSDLLKTHPHLKDFMAFLEHLQEESERGQVLITAAVVDDLLLRTLAAFLIEGEQSRKLLEGFNAPLGTFSARIAAAAALGLVSEHERQDADAIRKIRNDFAHSLTATFDSDSMKARCAALHFSAKDYGTVTVGTRGQFSSAATALILNLTNRPHYVGKERLEARDWPY